MRHDALTPMLSRVFIPVQSERLMSLLFWLPLIRLLWMGGDKLFGLIRNHFPMKGRTNIFEIQSWVKFTFFPLLATVISSPRSFPPFSALRCISTYLAGRGYYIVLSSIILCIGTHKLLFLIVSESLSPPTCIKQPIFLSQLNDNCPYILYTVASAKLYLETYPKWVTLFCHCWLYDFNFKNFLVLINEMLKDNG